MTVYPEKEPWDHILKSPEIPREQVLQQLVNSSMPSGFYLKRITQIQKLSQ